MFTPFELQKIANKCAIKANPYDYSLNHKIILKDVTKSPNHIHVKKDFFQFIKDISNKIYNQHYNDVIDDDDGYKLFQDLFYKNNISFSSYTSTLYKNILGEDLEPSSILKSASLPSINSVFSNLSDYSSSFNDVDSFHAPYLFLDSQTSFQINIPYYLRLKYFDESLEKEDSFLLKKPHLMNKVTNSFNSIELEALFTFNLHLEESNIHPLSYTFIDHELSYHDIKSNKNIKNFIKHLDSKLLDKKNYSFSFMNFFLNQEFILEKMPKNAHMCTLAAFDSLPEDFSRELDSRFEIGKHISLSRNFEPYSYFIQKYLEVIVYYIEMLYIIQTKLPSNYQEVFYNLLRVNSDNDFLIKNIYNPITLEINEEVLPIVNEKDSETRYNMLQDFIKSDTFKLNFTEFVKDYVKLYKATEDNSIGNAKQFDIYRLISSKFAIPTFVLQFTSFIKNKAIFKDAEIFASNIIAYAKLKKYVLRTHHTSSYLSEDLIDKAMAASEPTTINPFDTYEHKESSESEMPETSENPLSKNSNMLSENLDRLVSSFKEKGHEFTIKEVKASSDAKEKYIAVASKIKLLNSLLIKQIREIKTYNQGSKLSGLSHGRIDSKNLYKYQTSDNLFYNNKYEIRESDLAIGIVLDASGSMSGQKIIDGKISMVLLHETLRALNINHSIVDHTANGHHTTIIRRYYDFKESKYHTVAKAESLIDIIAREGNNDAGALYYMEQALLKTNNKDKVCLIFSDGEPTECSDSELKDQVKAMERKGIKVIGIGINLPEIANYYSDYANGKNLSEMVNIITKILKQYVLDKVHS